MILIRTINNLSYFGYCYVLCNNIIKIKINLEMDLWAYLPKYEITQIIYKNTTFTYESFTINSKREKDYVADSISFTK